MGRTFIRQDDQIRRSVTYDDTVAAGSTMESAPVSIEDDLNNIRSQLNRILLSAGGGNWYDDVPTVNSKQRGLSELNTDLDDMEEKRLLCPVQKLTNVTVPAAVKASGTVTAIAKASVTDGQTLTLDDGINTATIFEFDIPPDGVGGGNVVIDLSADTTDIQVASRMVSAINGVGATLLLTADNAGGTSAVVTITHDREGTVGNVTTWATTSAMVIVQPTGGSGDVVVLNDAASETPDDSAAIGTGLGAVVAVLAGDVGSWSPDVIAGTTPIAPKNLVWIRDHQNHEGLTSDDKQVYGIIQAEAGVVQDDNFNDTDKQVQISFVRITDNDVLEQCPGIDIGGKTVEYVYSKRVTLDTLPEDCNFPNVFFTDGAASVSVTLNNAIDNQGITPATQSTDINIWMDVDQVEWHWNDTTNTKLFGIHEGAVAGDSEVRIHPATDNFLVDSVNNNFSNGASLDISGTQIDIGITAGHVETTGANDLHINAGQELFFDDANQVGSSWAQTDGIKLSETQTEWNDFETEFGEVSILNALIQAKNTGGLVRTRTVAVVNTSNINPDVDVGGPGTANNLDVDLQDMSSLTFVDDVDIYLNGVLMRNGADATANHDVYPGSTGVQLKFEFKLKGSPGNPDVITQVTWAGV